MTEKINFRSLDTGTLIDAIGEVNDVLVDDIYANWVGVFRRGALLGFAVSNGVEMTFRPVNAEMQGWFQKRTEMDDENP